MKARHKSRITKISATVDEALSKLQQEYGDKVDIIATEISKEMQANVPAIYVIVKQEDEASAREALPMSIEGFPVRVKSQQEGGNPVSTSRHTPSATETALRGGSIGTIIYKGAKYVSMQIVQKALRDELMAILGDSRVTVDDKHKHSISIGHNSALFEGQDMYLRVQFRPYPHFLYEVGFPGAAGDSVSRHREDIIKAIQAFFDTDDRDGG